MDSEYWVVLIEMRNEQKIMGFLDLMKNHVCNVMLLVWIINKTFFSCLEGN